MHSTAIPGPRKIDEVMSRLGCIVTLCPLIFFRADNILELIPPLRVYLLGSYKGGRRNTWFYVFFEASTDTNLQDANWRGSMERLIVVGIARKSPDNQTVEHQQDHDSTLPPRTLLS